jgi:hypothetical protein
VGVLAVLEEFLKRSDQFLTNLAEEKNLNTYFVNSNLAILLLSACYGATMGLYAGGLQIIYSAVKVPILILLSLYLTVPSYYVLYSLLGGKRSLRQTITLLLSGFTIMAIILIAFVPVNLFFIITTPRSSGAHSFTALLNIAIFTLGGFFALIYLIRGARVLYKEPSEEWKPAFLVGSVILAFVGTQLAWVLRPFFNYYEFFIRPLESNFYTAVILLIFRFAGFLGAVLVLGGLGFLALLFLLALLPPKRSRNQTEPPETQTDSMKAQKNGGRRKAEKEET